ncbi:MAG TPA: type VI secretion system baseplate subunit TssE [Thermoanaerobaculia bacterium]|nr:type VI secretion system baseplate subunit TssE [Thermoanaerobaculia bacterium]
MGELKNEVRMPLFDRLVDKDRRLGREARPLRTLGRRDLKESVRRELVRLFNTRCPIPAHRLGDRPRTVIDYGIPDLSGFSARSPDDRSRLAEVLLQAVEAFEPRLANVRVHLDPIPGDDLSLSGRIEAALVFDSVAEPVSFVTVLQMKDNEVEVHDGA